MSGVRDWLRTATDRLAAAGLDEASVKAEWLLAERLRKPRWRLHEAPERAIPHELLPGLAADLSRLVLREPLQYVIGHTEFMGRRFLCDRRALIPRPETEELAALALADDELWSRPEPVVADVGTGTGCLALTLALERPHARVLGIDLYPEALALARENARQLGEPARLHWRQGDLLDGLPPASLDAVISNPPYVSEAEWPDLAVELREHEPRTAFVAGPGGLETLARLAEQAFVVLRVGGRLWLEMGSTQEQALAAHVCASGFCDVAVRPDLAGLPRLLKAVRR